MDTPLYGSHPTAAASPRSFAPALKPPLARTVIATAALLGISADAFMRGLQPGLGLALWIALLGINAVVLVWRAGRSVSRETSLWLVGAAAFALATAWRNAEELQALDVLATVACLAMAAIATRDAGAALLARRLRDTCFAAIDVARGVAVGVLPLAFREAAPDDSAHQALGRVRSFVRPLALAAVAILIFGSLLRSADPIFASVFAVPAIDLDTVASHVVIAGFFAWIVAGWARAALANNPTIHRAPAGLPIRLDSRDITATLGTLIVLFAAFIGTQLGWFFGGEAFLRARTGLTAAAYARQGFFQMMWIVILVVPILVATRVALGPTRELTRRHTMLGLPLVGLLGAIIVSAMLRLQMYVHFYGLTTDRLYPMAFMVWLAVVLVWLSVTVLRDWGRPFVAGAVLSALATLLTLNAIDPDAIVARVNLERARAVSVDAAQSLDVRHLASLRGGGVEPAVHALLDRRASSTAEDKLESCNAAKTLLTRWGTGSRTQARAQEGGAWRFWNHDDAIALGVVAKHEAALRAIQAGSCLAKSEAPAAP